MCFDVGDFFTIFPFWVFFGILSYRPGPVRFKYKNCFCLGRIVDLDKPTNDIFHSASKLFSVNYIYVVWDQRTFKHIKSYFIEIIRNAVRPYTLFVFVHFIIKTTHSLHSTRTFNLFP